ncbi:MAG: energy transducer TonB [Methylococcaceae bacterium]
MTRLSSAPEVWAFLLASVIHAVILFGLITPRPPAEPPMRPTLEVTLATHPAATGKALTPETWPNSTPVLAHLPEPLPEPKPASLPAKVKPTQPTHKPHAQPVKTTPPAPSNPPAVHSLPTGMNAPTTASTDKRLSADLLSQQISALSAELNRSKPDRLDFQKKTAIEALNLPKYKTTAYEQAWQSKVERVGNLNYPEIARKNRWSGVLRLSVSLKADGSVLGISVRQSSGHPELDEAAARIVRLAAPYAQFPDEFKAETDILVITRTWQFQDDFRLNTTR